MSFYELSPDHGDTKTLVRLVPILADWLRFHAGEPFDLPHAQYEFNKHQKEYQIERLKNDEERVRTQQHEETDLFETCRKIGESHFQIRLNDADGNERLVSWSESIKDPLDGYSFGTPRESWPIGWVRPSLDPRQKSQKPEYIHELKKLFDGMSQRFSHQRNREFRGIEKAPFEPRPKPKYVFSLTLVWFEKL